MQYYSGREWRAFDKNACAHPVAPYEVCTCYVDEMDNPCSPGCGHTMKGCSFPAPSPSDGAVSIEWGGTVSVPTADFSCRPRQGPPVTLSVSDTCGEYNKIEIHGPWTCRPDGQHVTCTRK